MRPDKHEPTVVGDPAEQNISLNYKRGGGGGRGRRGVLGPHVLNLGSASSRFYWFDDVQSDDIHEYPGSVVGGPHKHRRIDPTSSRSPRVDSDEDPGSTVVVLVEALQGTSAVPLKHNITNNKKNRLARWLSCKFGALHPEGRWFESRSICHVGTLGKSFTHSCL